MCVCVCSTLEIHVKLHADWSSSVWRLEPAAADIFMRSFRIEERNACVKTTSVRLSVIHYQRLKRLSDFHEIRCRSASQRTNQKSVL